MGRTLVAFFSATGATKRLAEKIANTICADIFEIKPLVEYTKDDLKWPSRNNRTCMEMKNKRFRPRISNGYVDLDEYDEIFLGFPIWYFTAPTIINTFIEQNNFAGKKVYVFVTSGVNTVDKSIKDLQTAYPYINFVSGKRFRSAFYPNDLVDWINECEGERCYTA